MTHQSVSYMKSGIRIGAVIIAVILQNWQLGFIMLAVAEFLGILEEVVDKRKE